MGMEIAPGPRRGDAFGDLMLAQEPDRSSPQFELVERDDGLLGVMGAEGLVDELRASGGRLKPHQCRSALADLGGGRLLRYW